MLTTRIEVHTYLGLKVLPFFKGAKKWGGHGRPGCPYGTGPGISYLGYLDYQNHHSNINNGYTHS